MPPAGLWGCRDAPAAVSDPRTQQEPRPCGAARGSDLLVSVSTQSAPEGIRTPNLLIRSQMLYPLSYGRLSRFRMSGATGHENTRAGPWGEIAVRRPSGSTPPEPAGAPPRPPLATTLTTHLRQPRGHPGHPRTGPSPRPRDPAYRPDRHRAERPVSATDLAANRSLSCRPLQETDKRRDFVRRFTSER